MKTYRYILLLLVVGLTACSLDVPRDENIFAFGVIERNKSDIVLTDDANQTYLLNNIKYDEENVGKRYYIEGTAPAGIQNKKYNYVVNVAFGTLVRIFEPQAMPTQEELNSVWNAVMTLHTGRIIQTGKYLNVDIEYYGDNPENHIFAYFVDNEIDEVSNTIKIYLCQNRNGDTNTNPTIGKLISSLDMTTIFGKFSSDFNVVLVYNDYQEMQKELTIKIWNINK